jgi:hypothetical protein
MREGIMNFSFFFEFWCEKHFSFFFSVIPWMFVDNRVREEVVVVFPIILQE